MPITSRLTELRRKHKILSDTVRHEQQSPASDTLYIAELKKQKLRLKEEITALSGAQPLTNAILRR